MAIIEIIQYPDKRLARVGKRVEVFDQQIKKIIDDMFETHYHAKNCAALAATQLAFANPYAITVIDFSEKKDQPLCLVNPEIIAREGEYAAPEGCMSVPGGIYETVCRAEKIKVRALDREGKAIEIAADGFLAKCIQHEIDHLHGKIILDHFSRLKRSRAESKIKKFHRFQAADK